MACLQSLVVPGQGAKASANIKSSVLHRAGRGKRFGSLRALFVRLPPNPPLAVQLPLASQPQRLEQYSSVAPTLPTCPFASSWVQHKVQNKALAPLRLSPNPSQTDQRDLVDAHLTGISTTTSFQQKPPATNTSKHKASVTPSSLPFSHWSALA